MFVANIETKTTADFNEHLRGYSMFLELLGKLQGVSYIGTICI